MKILFLGAPGAGKGTQAEIVSQKLNIPTISTGAMIREALKAKTEMGLAAKSYIDAGELVPDEVVIGIVKDRLAQDDCKNGFILDGFPRTLPQAEALEQMGIALDAAVNIFVPDEKIIKRMSGRRVCDTCGATFHVVYKPTAKEGVCDKCGGTLKTRSDDFPAVVKDRLEVYHKQTEPLERYYADRSILLTVIGQEELKDTTRLTLEALHIHD
ncbi:MAG TPA: adenylate kinase [Clostridiales bacterium]|jgi:adenylate kinase|nr:adenylate kinase [Clostridiales bacterium]